MLANIVLAVLLHLSGQKEPVDPSLIPGMISVMYRDGVTSEQRRAFEKSVGLPEPTPEILDEELRPFEKSVGLPESTPKSLKGVILYNYKVTEGHEKFWEVVLKDFAIVRMVGQASDWRHDWADLHRHTSAAAKTQTRLELHFMKSPSSPSSPLATASVSFTQMLDAKIDQYFRDNYASIATVNVIKRGDNFIELSIDKMKGKVINEPQFWERLDIYLVFFQEGNGAMLHVVYDGYFATGIGSKPPPDESYSNMSKQYDRELSLYADITTTALKSYLEKNQ